MHISRGNINRIAPKKKPRTEVSCDSLALQINELLEYGWIFKKSTWAGSLKSMLLLCRLFKLGHFRLRRRISIRSGT